MCISLIMRGILFLMYIFISYCQIYFASDHFMIVCFVRDFGRQHRCPTQ